MKSGKGEESSGSDKEADEESPVPVFGDALSSLVVWRYLCSYKINNACLSRLEHLDRKLLFIHHTQKQS
jgi:hypothetical protein